MKSNSEGIIASKYLIIGGAPKSGTTSLFRYLSGHPEVCAASRKETYFFAREFDLKNVCKVSETLKSFESYFSHCGPHDSLRIEATPYTLYSGSAKRIAEILPNARVLFILRDPVERLLSDYRMAVQREHPSARGTIEHFIEWQIKASGKHPPSLIEMGCYIRFLRHFLEAFGKDRVLIVFFEELIANPLNVLGRLCTTLNLNASFYSQFEFVTFNKTQNTRFTWLNRAYISLEPLVASVRARLMRSPKALVYFEKTLNAGKKGYSLINFSGSTNKNYISPETRGKLSSYYQPFSEALSEEIGRDVPWDSFQKL